MEVEEEIYEGAGRKWRILIYEPADKKSWSPKEGWANKNEV